jgi:serine/threonine protein kinase
MTPKKREVTLLAQLKHPYIIQMLDAFIDENMLIIIFEWAPAGQKDFLFSSSARSALLHAGTQTASVCLHLLLRAVIHQVQRSHHHAPFTILLGECR